MSVPQGAAQGSRNEIIDAFRGLAILAVLAFHYLFRWAPPRATANLYGFEGSYPWPSFGWGGVQLFFIVSGLVIAMTLLRSESPFDFAVRRVARIYPAFLFAATAIALVLLLHDPLGWKVRLSDYLLTLTLLPQNLGHWSLIDGAFWSLTVEVRFYVYAALAFLLLRERFWLGLTALGVLGNLAWTVSPQLANGLLLARSLPPFLLGVSIWLAVFERKPVATFACLLPALAFYFLHVGEMNNRFGPSWLAHGFILGSGGLMALLLWKAPDLPAGPLAWIGRISYSLYLFHQKLGVTLIHDLKVTGAPDLVAVGLTLLLMFGAGWLGFRFIEEPGQRALVAGWRGVRKLWRERARPA